MHEPTPSNSVPFRLWFKLGGFVVFLALVGTIYWQFGDYLRLDWLAQHEAQLKEFHTTYPVLVLGGAFVIYVAVTGLSLPGATVMTLALAWYLGFWQALVLVSFASTLGATIAFLLSRYFFREAIEHRFGERLETFDRALEREGPFYLFTLRLMPTIPFFVINAVLGLTKVRTWTYWWVSQLGMLPGTCVYVYAGSRIPDLQTLSTQGVKAVFTPAQLSQLTLAFVLLALFPLLTRWLLRWLRPSALPDSSQPETSNKA